MQREEAGEQRCSRCNGEGVIGVGSVKCRRCKGSGRVQSSLGGDKTCGRCRGTGVEGYYFYKRCPLCQGTGKQPAPAHEEAPLIPLDVAPRPREGHVDPQQKASVG